MLVIWTESSRSMRPDRLHHSCSALGVQAAAPVVGATCFSLRLATMAYLSHWQSCSCSRKAMLSRLAVRLYHITFSCSSFSPCCSNEDLNLRNRHLSTCYEIGRAHV